MTPFRRSGIAPLEWPLTGNDTKTTPFSVICHPTEAAMTNSLLAAGQHSMTLKLIHVNAALSRCTMLAADGAS